MYREDLIEAIVEGSKYRTTLTRLAKRFDTNDVDFDRDGGTRMDDLFPRHAHLPVVKKIRRKAAKIVTDYDAVGSPAWSKTLQQKRKGEGLQRALIKVHSRKAKLRRQGYGPEMNRWKALKKLPVPTKHKLN
jgi:hypothetical protein